MLLSELVKYAVADPMGIDRRCVFFCTALCVQHCVHCLYLTANSALATVLQYTANIQNCVTDKHGELL